MTTTAKSDSLSIKSSEHLELRAAEGKIRQLEARLAAANEALPALEAKVEAARADFERRGVEALLADTDLPASAGRQLAALESELHEAQSLPKLIAAAIARQGAEVENELLKARHRILAEAREQAKEVIAQALRVVEEYASFPDELTALQRAVSVAGCEKVEGAGKFLGAWLPRMQSITSRDDHNPGRGIQELRAELEKRELL